MAPGRPLDAVELEWKQRLMRQLLQELDLARLDALPEDAARSEVREAGSLLLERESAPLALPQRRLVVGRVADELLGLGPLEALLADPDVSDILVNGPGQVYVERHGALQGTAVRFNDTAHLMNIIDRIVSASGRRVDEACPMVDARLADGSRVNVIIPPLAVDGPVLSVRRFPARRLTAEDLLERGTLPEGVLAVLRAAVRGRLNVVISGGTGSGKTTLLNALSAFVPAEERIVTIEDAAELQLQQPHVVRLETRPPNIEGRGAVSQRDLVRNALRMRPDRIVVGEVRAVEALDMLQAMNTGHEGSLTTVHANSPRDALSRIETMVALSGLDIPLPVLRAQMASALHLVVQVARDQDGQRRLLSVQELAGMDGERLGLRELFCFERRGIDAEGRVQGHWRACGVVPGFRHCLAQRGLELPEELFNPDRTTPA